MRRLVMAAAVALALTGCTGEVDGATDVAAPATSGPVLPQCDDVWIIGEKLPEDYRGCYDRNGEGVPASYMSCGGGNGWGEEVLWWHEDGPLTFLTWSASKHDYPVEWQIEDGNQIGRLTGNRLLEASQETCGE